MASNLNECAPSTKPASANRAHLQPINDNETIAPSLRKSSSFQNIKSSTKSIYQKLESNLSTAKKNNKNYYSKHSSTQNITDSSTQDKGNSAGQSPLTKRLANGLLPDDLDQVSAFDQEQIQQINANRISVNSDLLSRVEKEKREYENRISDLTQITESRKIEIEKLTFELRNCREEMQKATKLASSAMVESNHLRSQLESMGVVPETLHSSFPTITEDGTLTKTAAAEIQQNRSPSGSAESAVTSSQLFTHSGTGRPTTGGNFTMSSFSSNDFNPYASSSLMGEFDREYGGVRLLHAPPNSTSNINNTSISNNNNSESAVANLQGRLLQMEEDNYTTTEELQATMQELCDLQRSLDEAQDANRSLAFEREILLESLCTQTTKLEHCRLQINQLKQLLVTSRDAQTPGTREAHFCELYASIDQEKQALLAQNSDLAQSSDSLAHECRLLSDKLALLQAKYDSLEAQHKALATVMLSSDGTQDHHQLSAGDEWLSKIQQESDQALNHLRADMNTRISNMQEEIDSLRDQLDLARVEHEREATEWRLYERDLLKTVRVADGIRTEVEEEMRHMVMENHSLQEQVLKLQGDLVDATTALANSTMSIAVAQQQQHQQQQSQQQQQQQAVISPLKPQPQTPIVASKQASTGLAVTSTPTGGFLQQHHHHRLHRATIHGMSPSVGAAGSSAPHHTGTTVRNLIQSIESQVKAFQHQKIQRQISEQQQQNPNYVLRTPSSRTSSISSASATRSPSLCMTNSTVVVPSSSGSKSPVPSRRQSDTTAPVVTVEENTSICAQQVAVADSTESTLDHQSSECVVTTTQDSSNSNVAAVASAGVCRSMSLPEVGQPQHHHCLQELVRQTKAGSKRNALLKWCQLRTTGYDGVEVNNFSSSWNNGLALCALLHAYLPDKINWTEVASADKKRCFEVAFAAAESAGISTTLRLSDMLNTERPDWNAVMNYISSIYVHFNSKD